MQLTPREQRDEEAVRAEIDAREDEFIRSVEAKAGAIPHPLENARKISSLAELKTVMADKLWRLNNLYFIIDKKGNKVPFRLNAVQLKFLEQMWYFNLCLKDRQRGFTTLIDLYLLDECLFNANLEANIIAHKIDDAQKIFRRKIKFPYDNLPSWIRDGRPLQTKSVTELSFNNGSTVYVSTSARSGTIQLLHVSEFGKICAQFPGKATEIVTGSMPAISEGNLVFIESTAEGATGYFYDWCTEALNRQKNPAAMAIGKRDFRIFFTAWWSDPEKTTDQPCAIPGALTTYFKKIEAELGIKLTNEQKWWYTREKGILGDKMKQENPSSPEEAFEKSVEGAYFATQLTKAYEDARICSVPHNPGLMVDTWWDLGMNDDTSIWFTQNVGRELHVIDFYENNGEGLKFYAKILDGKKEEIKYRFGRHFGPHDLKVRELGPGKSRWQSAREVGINFEIVPRVEDKLDSIEAARNIFPICWFDAVRCAEGIKHLQNYRKEWNEGLQTYRNHPLHDEHSNAADAFQTLAMGHQFGPGIQVQAVQRAAAAGWT